MHDAPDPRPAFDAGFAFEFINLDTQRPISAAMNAVPKGGNGFPAEPGDVLRTSLVDERGTVWSLSASGVTGIGIVSVGLSSIYKLASPAEIGSLLQRQDEMSTNMTFEPGRPDLKRAFVFGSTTPIILPGQSVTVVMNFVQDSGEMTPGPPPKGFQMTTEIVVGVVTTGTKKSYTLYNLTFDGVSLPGGGT